MQIKLTLNPKSSNNRQLSRTRYLLHIRPYNSPGFYFHN